MRSIAKLAAYSGVAGFGLSGGRATWRKFSEFWPLLLLFFIVGGVVVAPYYGAKNLVRGYDRDPWETLFKTVLLNLVVLASGWILAIIPAAAIMDNIKPQYTPIVLTLIILPSFIVGLFKGSKARPHRLRGFQIEKDNRVFLKRTRITETGGTDITHYDGDQTPLRFIEQSNSQLVFMVVGRRGKRAFINLDNEGRMISYSPPN